MMERRPIPRPSKLRLLFTVATSVLFLGAATGLFFLALNYKRKHAEWLRKEMARLQALPLLDYARDNYERADRLSRLPAADPEDVKGLCENAIDASSKAAELRPDWEEPFRVRGRALELQYRFEEAESDYVQAIRLHRTSYAHLHRGLLGVRRASRSRLIGAVPPGEIERAEEDLRLHLAHSSGVIQDERNRFVASAALGHLLGEHSSVPLVCETATRLDPTEWICPFVQGLSLLALDRLEPALQAFDAAVRTCPYAAEPQAYRAQVLRRLGRTVEAREALDLALERDEGFLEAWYLRGLVSFETRRYEEARADFLRCVSVHDARCRGSQAGLEDWLRGGRKDGELIEAVLAELDEFLRGTPAHLDALLARARARIESGRAGEALPDVNAILSKEPRRQDVLLLRARIHIERKDWDAADLDLTAAGHVRERARIRGLAGRIDDAIADLDLLLLQDARDASLYLERARLLLGASRLDDAIRTLDRLDGVNSGLPASKVLRAEAMLAQKDFEAALRLATEAHQSDPQLGEALLVRGRARLGLGQAEEAAKDFARAVEINPTLKDRVPP